MIVVTPDVPAYLFLPGERTEDAEKVLTRDAAWSAPLVWRQEMEQILTRLVRAGSLPAEDAFWVMERTTLLFQDREYAVPPDRVFDLAGACLLRAHELEFVALARELGAPLVTSNRTLNAAFPADTVTLKEFWSR